jgi:multiple antibiotic resistance protein
MLFVLSIIKAIVALFIVIDPLGNIPLFITLTEKMNKEKRRRTFQTATFISLILLLIFALLGQQILALFGISLHAFMIAGGLLLLVISMKTLVFEEKKIAATEEIGAVPIATPLLIGPGAITTTIVILQTYGIPITLISVMINFLIIRILFKYIDRIYKFLGRIGSLVTARIMAIFLAAIAIKFVLEGIRKAFF